MAETAPVTIETSKTAENELEIPRSLMPDLSGGQYVIELGSRSCTVDLNIHRSGIKKAVLSLSDKALKKLLLPHGIELLFYKKKKRIVLGPFIGLIIDEKQQNRWQKIRPPALGPVPGGGLCCFFFLGRVSKETNQVKAFFLNKNNTWQCRPLPVPGVLFDLREEKQPVPLSTVFTFCASKVKIANPPVKLTVSTSDNSPAGGTFLGNPFEIRLLLQKNHNLTWVNTLMAVAASHPHGSAAGRERGRLLPARSALALAYPGKESEIMQKCLTFALETVQFLEKSNGFILEVQLDLKLTPDGNVFLKDARTRPRHAQYLSLGDPGLMQNIIWTPVSACFNLAGFKPAQNTLPAASPRAKKKFIIRVLKQVRGKKILFLNKTQQQYLGLKNGQEITLNIGVVSTVVLAATQAFDMSPGRLYLSKDAAENFGFYRGEPLRLIAASRNNLVLGPSLGMTVPAFAWPHITKVSFIKKRALLALKKGILFYCFHLDSVNWEKNCAEGYRLNPRTLTWEKSVVPVPHVIDDHGSLPGPQTVKSHPHKGNCHTLQWLNHTRTFGKYETVQALSYFKETAKSIPDTDRFSRQSLVSFLGRYRSCYIKHNFGRCGRQVFRVEKKGSRYVLKSGGSRVKTALFNSPEHLVRHIKTALGEHVIIQQGIELASYKKSPFDMRILMQKDSRQKWVMTSLNMRIGKPGAIVTNFAAGARDRLFFPGQPLPHPGLGWHDLQLFSLKVVCALESHFGTLGEVGLDVALDKNNRLWLLEANSRPSSMAYRTARSKKDAEKIYGNLMDYTVALVRNLVCPEYGPGL